MIESNWPNAIRALLAFRPFKRFYLVSGEQEWLVNRPEELWIPEESDFALWGKDGTSDIINLNALTHVRIDDDFGMVEGRKIWK